MTTREISQDEINKAVSSIKDNGFYVIKNYLKQQTASLLARRSAKYYGRLLELGQTAKPPVGMQNIIANDRGVNNIIYYDDDFLAIATTGGHLKILSSFLDDPYYGLLPEKDTNFILGQANVREGTTALPFHVDTRIVTHGHASWSMQGVLALSDKNSSSGGLRVRPKSHTLGKYPDSTKEYKDAIDVNLETGDFAIFDSQLHHATYASESNSPGWSCNLTYRTWWVKPQFDFYKMLGDKKLSSLSLQQQLILGACSVPSHLPNASPSLRTGYESLG